MKNLLFVALFVLLFTPSCTNAAFMESPPITPPLSESNRDPSRPYFDTPPTQEGYNNEYELSRTAELRAASHLYLIRELEKRNYELEIRIYLLERRLKAMRDGSNIPIPDRDYGDI